MSLETTGIWQTGVWDATVWADGVWREGGYATTWTEVSNNAIIYDEARNDQTTWDNGNTVWDITGNVIGAYWDETANTSYADATTNNVTWTEV